MILRKTNSRSQFIPSSDISQKKAAAKVANLAKIERCKNSFLGVRMQKSLPSGTVD